MSALLRSRSPEQAALELEEMEQTSLSAENKSFAKSGIKDSLLRRKYVLPFLLACVILFCNTATGINSIIGYNTDILLQSGLSDLYAHWGYVLFTFMNFLMTIVGMTLVDRKGRKFLFILGNVGHHRVPDLCGHAVSAHGKEQGGRRRRHPVHGGAGSESLRSILIKPTRSAFCRQALSPVAAASNWTGCP